MRAVISTVCLFLFFSAMAGWEQATVSRAKRSTGSSSEWRSYGGSPGGSRFSPLEQINRSTVGRLEPAWSYHTGDLELMNQSRSQRNRKTAFESTPLMVNGVIYISTPSQRVVALDADSGRELWTFDPQAGMQTDRRFSQHRGVAYWEGPALSKVEGTDLSGVEVPRDARIFSGLWDGRLVCLDAGTGRPCADFGEQGFLDLRRGVADRWPTSEYSVNSPPAIYKDLVITGASVPEGPSKGPSGDVRAFDARSGRLVWRFHTVPPPGHRGHETWEGESWRDRTGANVWSMMSVDVERGMVFLPTGSAAYDFYGADRKGENLFANSLVALEAATGKLRWHFQMVHHDIWDYDLPAQPVLITLRRSGRDVPAVAQLTKMGFVFVLNRLTGKPIFGVEERPVPQSTVPGEATWPTQPFPLKPPPLCRQEAITTAGLADFVPDHRKHCEDVLKQTVTGGVYMPAGLDLTLSFPGTLGGANWSGASFDASAGLLFVNVNELGRIARMERNEKESQVSYTRNSPWGAYARFWDPEGWPCQKPPWGTLNAVDLNKGEIAWKVPLGIVESLQKRGIPATGTPNLGGSIATAGGLVFIGGSNDRRFRAFDSRTGKEQWATELEASAHATPITYLGKNGRQYVVVAAGGGGYFSQDKAGDAVVAFALPSARDF